MKWYAGGDCCVETCQDEDYVCGATLPYNCIDPDVGRLLRT